MREMKKLLVLLLALTMIFVVACGNTEENNATTGKTEQTETDGTETEGTETADAGEKMDDDQYINTFINMWPKTFDPATGSDMYGNTIITNVLEPLIRMDEDESGNTPYIAAGAESWDLSDDGLTYTFKIRNNNKWDDGTPVTAKDYAFGIRRSADPKTASPYANLIYLIKNGVQVNEGSLPVEELGVETPDDNTLVITLENPCGYFLDLCMNRVFYPQREDYVTQYGDQYSTDIGNIPMCGPFVIQDMTINNEINLVKNDNFWNAENVKPSRVHIAILSDANTINNALMTGELDYASVGDPKWQQQFIDSGEYNLLKRTDPWTGYFMMNFGEKSNVRNTKITRAIAAVLDRQEVIDNAWNGTPVPAWSFVPPQIKAAGLDFNNEGEGPAKKLKEDIKDPKALFQEGVKELGGDPNSYKIVLLGSDPSEQGRIAVEAFQQQIENALGCIVEASNSDWNAFTNQLEAGDYDIAWLAWGADFNDPSNFLETAYSKTAAYKTDWVNEKYDALIEKAQKTVDPEERKNALLEAENILIYEDAAIVPINHSVSNIFRKKYIHGTKDNYFVTTGYQTIYTVGRE